MRRRRRGRYCSIFSRVSGQQGLRPASPSSSRPPLVSLAVSWGNEGKEEWDRRLRKVQREGGSVFSSSRRFFKESGALSHSVITVTLFSLFRFRFFNFAGELCLVVGVDPSELDCAVVGLCLVAGHRVLRVVADEGGLVEDGAVPADEAPVGGLNHGSEVVLKGKADVEHLRKKMEKRSEGGI